MAVWCIISMNNFTSSDPVSIFYGMDIYLSSNHHDNDSENCAVALYYCAMLTLNYTSPIRILF